MLDNEPPPPQTSSLIYKIMSASPKQKYFFVNLFFVSSILIFAFFAVKTWNFDVGTLELLKQQANLPSSSNQLGMDDLLVRQKNAEQWLRWGLFAASLLYLTGVFIGFYFIKCLIRSLKNLSKTSKLLASGELSSRTTIYYMDEIGKASIDFNHMADNFQRIIEQLRHLLKAIKKLSEGDFTTRVKVLHSEDEIGQVSISLNAMAQNFEQIIGHLHQLSVKVASLVNQLASASKQQVFLAQRQEEATLDISATSQEIMQTAKSLLYTVQEVSDVANHTSDLASHGQKSLGDMEVIMQNIAQGSQDIVSKLGVLKDRAGNINHVITTITKVADQTNLLSLNTAIEAERAGELGRGFMVIANEIRRLADQTAISTLNIENVINEITTAVIVSVMGVDEFSKKIEAGVDEINLVKRQLIEIIEGVHHLSDRFCTVNQVMQTQSKGAEQINEALSELKKTAQFSSDAIFHFRDTVQEIDQSAKVLIAALSNVTKMQDRG